ncbi:membrane protein [Bacteroidales bacterium]|nr:membrane protein [Bacteroidales bacterium]
MPELTLITPTLLFSAVSLILLAYTNRFLSYAQLIRILKEQYTLKHDSVTAAQIKNLRKRLYLTRNMQIFGIASLLFCVVSMLLIYIRLQLAAEYVFVFALLLFSISLCLCMWELIISVNALEIYLDDMEKKTEK